MDKEKADRASKETSEASIVLDAIFSGQVLAWNTVADTKANVTDTITIPDNRTQTKTESLSQSLLNYVDAHNASKSSLEEAFCRDIDAFNEAFQFDRTSDKPSTCQEVPASVCATLYDSGTCGGGWKLEVPPGTQRRLSYFSSDWKYRSV